MKKMTLLLLTFIATHCINAQEINGLWLSHVNSLQQGYSLKNSNGGKVILDFDKNTKGYLNTEKKGKISCNGKQTKLKIKGIKGKFKVQKYNADKIVLKDSKNKSYVFERLDLSHKLQMNAKEIQDFLLTQQCDLSRWN